MENSHVQKPSQPFSDEIFNNDQLDDHFKFQNQLHQGDLISIPPILTCSLSNFDKLDSLPNMTKSQCINTILEYMPPQYLLLLQIISKRFYNFIIPTFVQNVNIPQAPQFIAIDQKNKEIKTFVVGDTLNPERKWQNIISNPHQLEEESQLYNYSGLKLVSTSEFGGKYFLCGGYQNPAQSTQSPCFEIRSNQILRKSDMRNMRTYFSLVCLTKYEKLQQDLESEELKEDSNIQVISQERSELAQEFSYPTHLKTQYLYAIGGRGQKIVMKTIERYDINLDQWTQLKVQLNYERAFGSAIVFKNRFIYIIGGSSTSECVERIDCQKENEMIKAELILFQMNSYHPWFKEMILPINEESLMILGGEQQQSSSQLDEKSESEDRSYSQNEDSEQHPDDFYSENSKNSEEDSQQQSFEDEDIDMPADQRQLMTDKFMIIGNYYKTKNISQLYTFSIREQSITQLNDGQDNQNEQDFDSGLSDSHQTSQLPYHSDTFYHQFYLRDRKNLDDIYFLGGNHLYKMNFRQRRWDTISNGIYDFKSQ
eukprot:403359858